MRIVHLADVHIGVENYGKVDPQTGLSTRLRDFLDTFDEVVSYVLDNRVDLVLFCGDAYKSRDPSQTHQREFAARIARLSAAGIPVFLVVGNHDTPHTLGRASALEIFETLDVANVHIGDTLGTHVVQTADGPIQILAVPWIRRSVFLAREESRGLTPDQVNDEIQRRLAQAIRSMAEELDPDIPAVLAGHVTVGGSVTGSEQSMMLGRDHVLLKSDVALPQLDYVALGHIHRHQILGDAPLVVYPGSLQRIDFGEEGEEKGFMAFDLDPSAPAGSRLREHGFHKVSARDIRDHRREHTRRRPRSHGHGRAGNIGAQHPGCGGQAPGIAARRVAGPPPRRRHPGRPRGRPLRGIDIPGCCRGASGPPGTYRLDGARAERGLEAIPREPKRPKGPGRGADPARRKADGRGGGGVAAPLSRSVLNPASTAAKASWPDKLTTD